MASRCEILLAVFLPPIGVCFRHGCCSEPTILEEPNGIKVEWLIVGLGNPGSKYHGTRHNVGFEMIDHISKTAGVVMNTIQSKALIGIGSFGEVPVLLVKPQTYMNFSGESVIAHDKLQKYEGKIVLERLEGVNDLINLESSPSLSDTEDA